MKILITIRQMPTTMPVSSITSRRSQNEVFEDYSQVRVYYIQGSFSLSKLRSNRRLSLHLLSCHSFVLAQNSILFPDSPFFLSVTHHRKEEEEEEKKNIRISLMNCVRRVCEQHKKRKCICICKMGCGSTKAASGEEKNVREEIFFMIKNVELFRLWKIGDKNVNKNV